MKNNRTAVRKAIVTFVWVGKTLRHYEVIRGYEVARIRTPFRG